MGQMAPADIKARKLANYDQQIEQARARLNKLIRRRNAWEAEWDALNGSLDLPEGFDPLGAVEAFLADHGVKPAVFGRQYFSDPKFVFDLRQGRQLNELNQRKVYAIVRHAPSET